MITYSIAQEALQHLPRGHVHGLLTSLPRRRPPAAARSGGLWEALVLHFAGPPPLPGFSPGWGRGGVPCPRMAGRHRSARHESCRHLVDASMLSTSSHARTSSIFETRKTQQILISTLNQRNQESLQHVADFYFDVEIGNQTACNILGILLSTSKHAIRGLATYIADSSFNVETLNNSISHPLACTHPPSSRFPSGIIC